MAKIHLRERYEKPVEKVNGKKLVFNCPPIEAAARPGDMTWPMTWPMTWSQFVLPSGVAYSDISGYL